MNKYGFEFIDAKPGYVMVGEKEVKVSKKAIDKLMKVNPAYDEVEATYVWLCDEEYMTDPDQAKLLQASKENKVKMGARAEKPKASKPREKKIDDVKKTIIDTIAGAVGVLGEVDVQNPDKLIVLMIDGQEYKINLTKTRAKKG